MAYSIAARKGTIDPNPKAGWPQKGTKEATASEASEAPIGARTMQGDR
jgi:hypothetical protein